MTNFFVWDFSCISCSQNWYANLRSYGESKKEKEEEEEKKKKKKHTQKRRRLVRCRLIRMSITTNRFFVPAKAAGCMT